jgi:acyl-CoA dehydrogenase
MDLSIPLELRQIQDSVRAFIHRELAPLEQQVDLADDVDSATMQELRQRAVSLGIYGFNLPSELGGGGIGPLGEVLVGEEIGRTTMPLAEVIGRLPQSLVHCDQEQAGWLLKPALRAEKTACIALTEPEAGSDLGGIRTRAVSVDGGWQISGSKQFISNAETSDYILLLAVTDPSASLRDRFTVFVIDRTDPGLHFTHRFRKLGWHGYHISSFSLDDCTVGPDRVLGGVGKGFATMMASVNRTRLYIAARCVGAAQELKKLAANYAVTRQTFGQRLGQHEAIQFMLADMDVELETRPGRAGCPDRYLTRQALRHGDGRPRRRYGPADLRRGRLHGRSADRAHVQGSARLPDRRGQLRDAADPDCPARAGARLNDGCHLCGQAR